MPRKPAAPDPLVTEYTRKAEPRITVRIEAFKDGSYFVTRNGRGFAARGPQLGAYFGAPRYPSNRLQAEALETAKLRVESQLVASEK